MDADADYIFRNLIHKVKINETFSDGFTFFCKTHHENRMPTWPFSKFYVLVIQKKHCPQYLVHIRFQEVFSPKAIRLGFGFKLS
jgi:hypothetical protein